MSVKRVQLSFILKSLLISALLQCNHRQTFSTAASFGVGGSEHHAPTEGGQGRYFSWIRSWCIMAGIPTVFFSETLWSVHGAFVATNEAQNVANLWRFRTTMLKTGDRIPVCSGLFCPLPNYLQAKLSNCIFHWLGVFPLSCATGWPATFWTSNHFKCCEKPHAFGSN